MKNSIVYYSYTGNNKNLAEILAEKSGAELFELREKKKRSPFAFMIDLLIKRDLLAPYYIKTENYDKVILVSPVWAGKPAPALCRFLEKERNNIKEYSYISLCFGSEAQNEKVKKSLRKTAGKAAVAVSYLSLQGLIPPELKGMEAMSYKPEKEKLIEKFGGEIDEFVSTVIKA